MRAAMVDTAGSRWGVREVPAPDVNHVLIKIRASGLCDTDGHLTNGVLPATCPATLGHEPVGEIIEVGDGTVLKP
jgi:D-arabinose 1-dehydrogenase-like Zn-dependent alcohol dehydrogenase